MIVCIMVACGWVGGLRCVCGLICACVGLCECVCMWTTRGLNREWFNRDKRK